jgi:hypothetical protein
MKVLIHGNPVDGFHYVGPLGDVDVAIVLAETTHIEADWWVAELEAPDA